MSKIHVLDQQTANSIAAGEVVERPASVVKELVENSLDAGASVIAVEIRQGGIGLIRIADNGCGMDRDDAFLAFGRHATSKLNQIEDLDAIATMGFRGEALASIAAVARVRLETREPDSAEGIWLLIAGGELLDSGPASGPAGTIITVENLFYNVPARFKFLRKDATEAAAVTDALERLALARPDVSFRLVSNQQEVLHTPGNNDLMSTVYAIYGRQVAQACLTVAGQQSPLKISGLVGRPDLVRNSRNQQTIFVNGRLVRARPVTAALDDAYQTLLMKGKYAFAILFVDVPPTLVDVNVHPQKMEVRFWNDQEIFRLVYHGVKNALLSGLGIADSEEEARPDAVQTTAEPAIAPAGPTALPVAPRPPAEAVFRYPEPDTAAAAALMLGEPDNSNPGLAATGRAEPAPSEPAASAAGQALTGQCPAQSPMTQSLPVQPVLLPIDALAESRLIGTLFQTYLLLEMNQELLLVDQHAAHEKILFETLIRQSREDQQLSQPLLVPLVLEVSRSEMLVLDREETAFRQLGFAYDRFGDAAVALRAIPDAGRHGLLPEAAFRLALETIVSEPLDTEEKIADFYYSLACKAAVKAHDQLQAQEISQLLADLRQLDNPYQCPHGRPVIVRLSRYELEKRFKRIV